MIHLDKCKPSINCKKVEKSKRISSSQSIVRLHNVHKTHYYFLCVAFETSSSSIVVVNFDCAITNSTNEIDTTRHGTIQLNRKKEFQRPTTTIRNIRMMSSIDRIKELHFSHFPTPFSINFVIFCHWKIAHANIRSFSVIHSPTLHVTHSAFYTIFQAHNPNRIVSIKTIRNHFLFQCIKFYRITQFECILCIK